MLLHLHSENECLCAYLRLVFTGMHAMTSVGASQMRAFVMLELWTHSCPTDIKCHFKQQQRNMLLRGHLYHSYMAWFLWFVLLILALCLKMPESFIFLCQRKNVHSCSISYDILQLFTNAEGHKHSIKSCLEPMRSKVKNEKKTSQCGLQTAPSLELCGKADDPHHRSPVRVIGVRV